nr:unnamed protein product [Callosobruchus analis]
MMSTGSEGLTAANQGPNLLFTSLKVCSRILASISMRIWENQNTRHSSQQESGMV